MSGNPRRLSLTMPKVLTPKGSRSKAYNKLDDYEFSSPLSSPSIPLRTFQEDKSHSPEIEASLDDLNTEMTEIDLEMEEKVYQQRLLESPADRYNLAYIIFHLLGFGVLVPWITLLTAVDYFELIYSKSYNFEFNLSVAYTMPLCLGLLLMTRFAKTYAFLPRILTGFVIFLFSFVLIPFLGMMDNKTLSFTLTMILVGVCGCADAIVEGSLYGLSGMFPPLYTQAVQGGTGSASAVITLSRIITKASMPDTADGIRASSQFYFSISAFSMILCIVSLLFLMRLPITKYWMNDVITSASSTSDISAEIIQSYTTTLQDSGWRQNLRISYRAIFSKVWQPALMVLVNFVITLMVYPGFIALIPSTRGPEWTWFPVIVLSLFNFFDFLGKSLPIFSFLNNFSERVLYISICVRAFFLPLFFLCVNPRVFSNDVYPMVFISLFAVSNGFIGKLMMIGPTKVDKHEKEVTGIIMVASLCLGMTIGACIGWIIPYLM